jgi:hypothetical protein
MSIALLKTHEAIGWDVDGTLLDGQASAKLHAFIHANPEKRHCIVTFRTHDLLRRLERDMALGGYKDMSIFDKVLSVPQDMWIEWALIRDQRARGKVRGKLLLPETAYMEWKGFICRTEGLTVLVDDDMTNTKRGCDRHKIVLVNVARL